MTTRLNLKTRVLAGKRIEITDPQHNEGDLIDVQLTLPEWSDSEKNWLLERSPRSLFMHYGGRLARHNRQNASVDMRKTAT